MINFFEEIIPFLQYCLMVLGDNLVISEASFIPIILFSKAFTPQIALYYNEYNTFEIKKRPHLM